ncbi:uncharacterized protein LOC134795153 [Cydia splendana]|uniref:uncharacterized protein LOC134795153 n=1 Tax=Cydia splendana TaxID=1100963 RepID=UPI00300DABEE
MMELLSQQTQAIENIASRVANSGPKSDTAAADLDESFEFVPDSTESDNEFGAPSFDIGPQENSTALNVVPVTDSEEARLTAQIAKAQRKLAALKTPNSAEFPDCDFLPLTTETEAKLVKADPNLADQGRKCQRLNEDGWKNIRFSEVQKTFHATPVFAALKVKEIQKHLVAPDCTFKKISDGLLLC